MSCDEVSIGMSSVNRFRRTPYSVVLDAFS